MRAIIRYSVDGDSSNRTENEFRGLLEEAGFQKIGTASFEHSDIGGNELGAVMESFWHVARDPQSQAGADPGAHLDHVWFYADEPEDPFLFGLTHGDAEGSSAGSATR